MVDEGDLETPGIRIDGDLSPLIQVVVSCFSHSSVQAARGDILRGQSAEVSVSSDAKCLLFSFDGTSLIRRKADTRWGVLAPRSIAYLNGDQSYVLNVARGSHKLYFVTWLSGSAQTLSDWIHQSYHKFLTNREGSNIPCKAISSVFSDDLLVLERALNRSNDDCVPFLFSMIHLAMAKVMSGEIEIGLAPLPPDLPSSFKTLTDRVRKNPEASWPLKDASDMVGYSPFHFSRVFKSTVGFGFHEFVDRCRTEFATRLLSLTDDPIETVATNSGFGTSQSLRESVKDHLGLLPSELRGLPEEASTKDS